MKTVNFINLTNGLEWLDEIEENVNYVHIASTTLEQRNWIKLFNDLDHNLLFNLVVGNDCYFYDCGTKRKNSKTVYKGIPLIKYILTRYWLGIDDESLCYHLGRDSDEKIFNCKDDYKRIYDFLFTYDKTCDKRHLCSKLNKYKNKFLLTNEIRLTGISKETFHDGDYNFYKNICIDKSNSLSL